MGHVKYAADAFAWDIENGRLRFVPATKTHDDIPFAAGTAQSVDEP